MGRFFIDLTPELRCRRWNSVGKQSEKRLSRTFEATLKGALAAKERCRDLELELSSAKENFTEAVRRLHGSGRGVHLLIRYDARWDRREQRGSPQRA